MTEKETVEITENAPFMERRCYTVEDLTIIMGIGRSTAYKLLEQHEFRWFKIGSAIRISKDSFDNWLDAKI